MAAGSRRRRHHPPAEAGRSAAVARVLAERAARLHAAHDEGERRAGEEWAQAQARAKADADAGRDTDAARSHRQAEALRQRRRRDSDERRQQAADAVALQVRLFDGSTVRSRFAADAPLARVRAWVDARRPDGAAPYTFRQVRTPLPNRAIDPADDEAKTLADLGLAPSSTLVLVPVRSYASAYDAAAEPRGFVAAALAAAAAWLAWLAALVGLGPAAPRQPAPADAPAARRRRIRGFDNAGGTPTRDHQLYNGNSVSARTRCGEMRRPAPLTCVWHS